MLFYVGFVFTLLNMFLYVMKFNSHIHSDKCEEFQDIISFIIYQHPWIIVHDIGQVNVPIEIHNHIIL
jgi:hypothetical protein